MKRYLPYLTFGLLFLAAFSYRVGLDYYQERDARESRSHWDYDKGRWKEGYDWDAYNRRAKMLGKVNKALLGAVLLHSIFNFFFAIISLRASKWHLLGMIFFGVFSLLWAYILLLGSIGGGMIG